MEGETIKPAYFTADELLVLLSQFDFGDFSSFVGETGTDNHKYTRLGVYSYDDDEDSWHRP